MLGLEASQDEMERAFELAAGATWVRGFAVGRTLFADAARQWLSGEIDDGPAVEDMATRFAGLVQLFESAFDHSHPGAAALSRAFR
jgi:5-dehydro-2-deoxygluconokinase